MTCRACHQPTRRWTTCGWLCYRCIADDTFGTSKSGVIDR